MRAETYPDLDIRTAHLGEVAMIAAFHQRGFAGNYPGTNFESSPLRFRSADFHRQVHDHILARYADDNTNLYLGNSSGRIAATTGITLYPAIQKAEIWGVQVAEQFRGRNFAKLMVLHALDHAETSGASSVDLHVLADSDKAIKLYKGLNFTAHDTEVFYDNCPRWSSGMGKANYIRMSQHLGNT